MGLHLGGLFSGSIPLLLYIAGLAAFLASVFWRPEVGIYYIVPLLPLQTIRYRLHRIPPGSPVDRPDAAGGPARVASEGRFDICQDPIKTLAVCTCRLVLSIAVARGDFLNFPLPFWFDNVRLSDWKNYIVIFLLFFPGFGFDPNHKTDADIADRRLPFHVGHKQELHQYDEAARLFRVLVRHSK